MKISENHIVDDYWNVLIKAKSMKLSTKEALALLDSRGYPISATTYFLSKKKLENEEIKWTHKVAMEDGLIAQHIQRIEILETIEHEAWLAYNRLIEDHPEKAVAVLPALFQVQPYISQAYRAMKNVMESQVDLKKHWQKLLNNGQLSRATGNDKPVQS